MVKDHFAGGRMERSRRTPVLLIGAGDGAELFIRAMAGNAAHPYRVVGVVDDLKRNLAGRQIREVKILGHVDDLPEVIERLERPGRPAAAAYRDAAVRRNWTALRCAGLSIWHSRYGFTIARLAGA